MRINFKRMRLRNFLSFGNTPTDFEFKDGLFYVTGENKDRLCRNGAGKTALFIDAISYAMFGKTIRKINLPEIVNDVNESECELTLWLEVGGRDFRIERGMDPRYLRFFTPQHKEGIEKSKVSLTQKEINTTLGVDYDTYAGFILSCINYSKSFLDLSIKEKRDILENILGVQIFGSMFSNVREEYNRYRNEIKLLEQKKDFCKEYMDSLVKQQGKFNKEQQKNKDKKEEELHNLLFDINQLNSKIIIVERFLKKYESCFEKLSSLEGQKLDAEKMVIDCEIKIQRYKGQYESLNNKLKQLSGNKCPVCNSDTNLQDVVEHIKEIKLEIKKIKTILIDKIKNRRENIGLLKRLKINIVVSKKTVKKYNDALMKNDYDIKLLPELELHRDELETYLKTNNFNKIIDEKEVEKSKEKYNDVKIKFDKMKMDIDYLLTISEILSDKGVKRYITARVLPYLNKRINYYLNEMDCNYVVKFDSSFKETIISRNRVQSSYHRFSGGEKKRIDLALLMAFFDVARRQSSIQTNLLVFDEALDTSLDVDGALKFLKILKQRVEEEKLSCYVISHREAIETQDNMFDGQIKLEKLNRFTDIERIE